ncbi:sugar isomerase [Sphingobacteriaceae bacterium]|nr:sugar isomerase [Sphingobacteriaceae bacterium]
MKITNHIEDHNQKHLAKHKKSYTFLAESVSNVADVVEKLKALQIAIPSWALGTGGTRFGRFSGGGEPATLEQKIEDVGLLHALNKSSGSISLHIPWDIPKEAKAIKALAESYDLKFDAVNSNTFQDQADQKHSYKHGSLHHSDRAVRKQAVEHNIEVIRYGVELGSDCLSVWLADGSSFPGQINMRNAFNNTLESLGEIYAALPEKWKMLIEYKPYEPYFYSTTIGDWGQSLLLANKLGKKAFTLVDLGHHLPNTNIEQIVSLLLNEEKLGGFHFNDSKYGDDDLTVGSINPYKLFLIYNELVEGMNNKGMNHATGLSWMIDASHNIKDPLEDLLQSVEAIKIAYAQSLIVDQKALRVAQENNDVVAAESILQDAYRTDVRPLLAEARLQAGAAIQPIEVFRDYKLREALIKERGSKSIASGL